MKSTVRFYLKYTPEVLDKMTIKQLVEAYYDVQHIRDKEAKLQNFIY